MKTKDILGDKILVVDNLLDKNTSRFSNVSYVRVRSDKFDYIDAKGNKKYRWLDNKGKIHITKTHPEDLWASGKIRDKWSYLSKGALLHKEAMKLLAGGNQITKQPEKFMSEPDWFYRDRAEQSDVK